LFLLIEPLPFHSYESEPTQPLKFRKMPSPSHPTPYSPQITANQATLTRAVPFQESTNVRATPTVKDSSNDWIPISQPNGPVATSYSQLSTSRPASSNSPILQDTASDFDAFTLNNGNNTFIPVASWVTWQHGNIKCKYKN
jgi:hypothetical protein